MAEEKVTITTADGDCPAYVFTPDEPGRHPGTILYMDAFGMRPTIIEMGRRLASDGYVVLVPDLFYRAGEYGPLDPTAAFSSGDVMGALGQIRGTTDNRRAAVDSEAFLDYLASRDDVEGTRVGLTGYCMGGAVALTVAGTYPDRVAAVGAFHTGGVITDSELSPHRVAPNITATVYLGGADYDPGYTPEIAAEFDELLTNAGVAHRSEIYPDARHGYTMKDFPVYDENANERHWRELESLFARALKD